LETIRPVMTAAGAAVKEIGKIAMLETIGE